MLFQQPEDGGYWPSKLQLLQAKNWSDLYLEGPILPNKKSMTKAPSTINFNYDK